jgi:hypothetical protein
MKNVEVVKSRRLSDLIVGLDEIPIVSQDPLTLTTLGSLTPGELSPLELL